jgi:hypothetical protein
VNALYSLRITDQLFKSDILHAWCVHNRLFNAYYEVKFKKHPIFQEKAIKTSPFLNFFLSPCSEKRGVTSLFTDGVLKNFIWLCVHDPITINPKYVHHMVYLLMLFKFKKTATIVNKRSLWTRLKPHL